MQFALDFLVFFDGFLKTLAFLFVFDHFSFQFLLIGLQNFDIFFLTFQFFKSLCPEFWGVFVNRVTLGSDVNDFFLCDIKAM